MSAALLRRHALSIFRATLAAADPADPVMRHLKRLDLARFRDVYVLGAGKAGVSMAQAAERVLGRRIAAGFVIVKDGDGMRGRAIRLRRIELNECGHPVPDARGTFGAERIAESASRAGERGLVGWLVSCGRSALVPFR